MGIMEEKMEITIVNLGYIGIATAKYTECILNTLAKKAAGSLWQHAGLLASFKV